MIKYLFLSVTVAILSFLAGYYTGVEKHTGIKAKVLAVSECDNEAKERPGTQKRKEYVLDREIEEVTAQGKVSVASKTKERLEDESANDDGGLEVEELMTEVQREVPAIPDIPLTDEQQRQKDELVQMLRDEEIPEEKVQQLSTDMVLSGFYADILNQEPQTREGILEQLKAELRGQGELEGENAVDDVQEKEEVFEED